MSPAPTPVVAKTDTLESYGCTKCSDDSLFACTNLPQSNALKSGETIPAGTPSLISNYKMVEYDVETPSYTFGGKNYWWRQRGGCPSGPAPAALASAAPKIPDPLDKAKFASRKCNSASTRDGNCIPVCVPLNMQKVSGPAYGDPKNAMGRMDNHLTKILQIIFMKRMMWGLEVNTILSLMSPRMVQRLIACRNRIQHHRHPLWVGVRSVMHKGERSSFCKRCMQTR